MKCLNGASLEAYIETLQRGRPNPEIDAHLAICRRCALLVKHAARPMPAGLAKRAEQVGRLLGTKRPDAIEPGQIWRLREQVNTGRYPIGVITRGPAMSVDREHPDVRIAMASLDAREDEVGDDDIVVENKESPLGLRYLVEHWNERPVPADELDIFLGHLEPAAWKRLVAALNDLGEEREDLTEAVRAYRARRIRETALLSQASLERAARVMSDGGHEGWTILVAANEQLSAVANDKSLSLFREWGNRVLESLLTQFAGSGLTGRESREGFRFRLRDASKNLDLKILGPDERVLET
ncbi:MAG TPA: hypothetical protein PKM25_15290, partial [Candidatus Ozemobacteraceae bacterium]|nr:hypothetical protein [Candidatus Ozemobacteraceae bacterium]